MKARAKPGLSERKKQQLLVYLLGELDDCHALTQTLEALIEADEESLRAVRSKLVTVSAYMETWLLSPYHYRARGKREREAKQAHMPSVTTHRDSATLTGNKADRVEDETESPF